MLLDKVFNSLRNFRSFARKEGHFTQKSSISSHVLSLEARRLRLFPTLSYRNKILSLLIPKFLSHV